MRTSPSCYTLHVPAAGPAWKLSCAPHEQRANTTHSTPASYPVVRNLSISPCRRLPCEGTGPGKNRNKKSAKKSHPHSVTSHPLSPWASISPPPELPAPPVCPSHSAPRGACLSPSVCMSVCTQVWTPCSAPSLESKYSDCIPWQSQHYSAGHFAPYKCSTGPH